MYEYPLSSLCIGLATGGMCIAQANRLEWPLIAPVSWAVLGLTASLILRARIPHRVCWISGLALTGSFALVYGSFLLRYPPMYLFGGYVPLGTCELTICGGLLVGLLVRSSVFEYVVDTDTCRQCGYLLKGLPEHRCPECGTTWVSGQLYPRLQKRKIWQRTGR
jgi:hypothetical protein